MNWYLTALKNYAVFSGRARRTEYWMFVLISFVIAILISLLDGLLGSPGILSGLYSLAILIPSIAVAIRRLHDTDRSGWWLLICLVPVIGAVVLLVFLILEGSPGANQYGANPKGA